MKILRLLFLFLISLTGEFVSLTQAHELDVCTPVERETNPFLADRRSSQNIRGCNMVCEHNDEDSDDGLFERISGGMTVPEWLADTRFFSGGETSCLEEAGLLRDGNINPDFFTRQRDVGRFYNQCAYSTNAVNPYIVWDTNYTDQMEHVLAASHLQNRDSILNGFWQDLARRSSRQLTCRRDTIARIQNNQEMFDELVARAEERYNEIEHWVRLALMLKEEENEINYNDRDVHSRIDCSGLAVFFCRDLADEITRNENNELEENIVSFVGSMPYGYEPAVVNSVIQMAQNGSFSRELYYSALTDVFNSYDNLDSYYRDRFVATETGSGRGNYCIDSEFKEFAVSSGAHMTLLNSMVESGLIRPSQREILRCKMKSKYNDGRRAADLSADIAFGVGAVAAGFLTGGATIGAYAAITSAGLSVGALSYQLGRAHTACNRNTFMIDATTGREECNPEEDFAKELNQTNKTECLIEAGLTIVEALPVPVEIAAIARAKRGQRLADVSADLARNRDSWRAIGQADVAARAERAADNGISLQEAAALQRAETPQGQIIATASDSQRAWTPSEITENLIEEFPDQAEYIEDLLTLRTMPLGTVDEADEALRAAHEAWKRNNRNLRGDLPDELFGDFDELPLSQRQMYADQLDTVAYRSNPDADYSGLDNYSDLFLRAESPPPAVARERVENVTEALHTVWLRNHRAGGGGERLKVVPLVDGETAEQALRRYEAEGFTGVRINESGELVQDINQEASRIIPALSDSLNGAPAARYTNIGYSSDFTNAGEIREALDDIHVEWLRHNGGWASDTQRLPFDQLPPSEQIKDLDVLEAVLRTRDPSPADTDIFRNYRARLQQQVTEENRIARGISPENTPGAEARVLNIEEGVRNVEGAWALTLRQMRREGIPDVPNPTPEQRRRILEIYDEANSRVSTPLGPGRVNRATNGGTTIVDSDAVSRVVRTYDDAGEVVSGSIPDYVARHVTRDHHGIYAQRYNPITGVLEDLPPGTNSTTQILDDIENLSAETFRMRYGNFASDNIGDAFGLARFVAQNADVIRANPSLASKLRQIAAQEDFSIFGLESAVRNDDQLAALLRLNDRTIPNVEGTFMDRVRLDFGNRTAAELEQLQADMRRIFLPPPNGDEAFTRGLANDFRDSLARAGEALEDSRIAIPDASGADSPMLLVRMDDVNEITRGPFEGWTAIPEFVRGVEETGGTAIQRTFSFSGDNTNPTRDFIFSNFSGRGTPMNQAVDGMDDSFVDLLKNAERTSIQRQIDAGTLQGDALTSATQRLSDIESGAWPPGRPGQLYFGNTFMQTDEIQGFVADPTTMRALGIEPPSPSTNVAGNVPVANGSNPGAARTPAASSATASAPTAATSELSLTTRRGVDVIPEGQTVPATGRPAPARIRREPGQSREEVLADPDNARTFRDRAQLSNEDRGDLAEDLLNTPLDDVQRRCINRAHRVGGNRNMTNFEFGDLREKYNVLNGCGFSSGQIATLFEEGVTGAVGTAGRGAGQSFRNFFARVFMRRNPVYHGTSRARLEMICNTGALTSNAAITANATGGLTGGAIPITENRPMGTFRLDRAKVYANVTAGGGRNGSAGSSEPVVLRTYPVSGTSQMTNTQTAIDQQFRQFRGPVSVEQLEVSFDGGKTFNRLDCSSL